MVIDPRACSDGDAVHAMTPDGPANLICKEGAPYPWTGARFDYDHDDLTDVVRLVPARKVTRQDLPGIPESPEVAHARMDDEACRITWDEHHHRVSTGRYGWAIDAAVVVALIGALALLMLGATILGELAGGWPA